MNKRIGHSAPPRVLDACPFVNASSSRCATGPVRRLGPIAMTLAVLTIGRPAGADMSRARQAEVFYQAQRAYEQGVQLAATAPPQAERLLREAAAGFQAIADDGVVNGRLYYNLANTCLRLRDVGRAVLFYRRAEALTPDDGRLAEGLRVARSIRRNDIPPTGGGALVHALLFWHYQTSLRGRMVAGAVFYVAFWMVAIAAMYYRHITWRYVLSALLVVWLALAFSVAGTAYAANHWREGVIVADEVVVMKDPGVGSSPEFQEKLHPGVEFELLEQHARWYRIRLPNAKTGWIPKESAELI
jgi:hypothetical protein